MALGFLILRFNKACTSDLRNSAECCIPGQGRMNSANQAAFNPFACSDKENFPSIDEVLRSTGATPDIQSSSNAGSLQGSFHDLPAAVPFSQSQRQQMKAAEQNLKVINRNWWRSRVCS